MKLITAKTASEIKLNGIKVELEMVDGTAKSATLTDADGNIVKFTQENYAGFRAYVAAPPEMKTQWRLEGEVLGVKIDESFDEQYLAMDRRNQLASALHNEPEFTITETQVEVAE